VERAWEFCELVRVLGVEGRGVLKGLGEVAVFNAAARWRSRCGGTVTGSGRCVAGALAQGVHGGFSGDGPVCGEEETLTGGPRRAQWPWTVRRLASVAPAALSPGDAWLLEGKESNGAHAGHGWEGRGAERRRPERGGAGGTRPGASWTRSSTRARCSTAVFSSLDDPMKILIIWGGVPGHTLPVC